MADRTTQSDSQTSVPGGGRPPNVTVDPDEPIPEKQGPERTLLELASDLSNQLRRDQARRRRRS